jgi:LemA protein
MGSTLLISSVVHGLAFAYGVLMYNRLVVLKHHIGKSWSNIDVLLRQRHDALPKLVEVGRQSMRHK